MYLLDVTLQDFRSTLVSFLSPLIVNFFELIRINTITCTCLEYTVDTAHKQIEKCRITQHKKGKFFVAVLFSSFLIFPMFTLLYSFKMVNKNESQKFCWKVANRLTDKSSVQSFCPAQQVIQVTKTVHTRVVQYG